MGSDVTCITSEVLPANQYPWKILHHPTRNGDILSLDNVSFLLGLPYVSTYVRLNLSLPIYKVNKLTLILSRNSSCDDF